MKKIYIFFMLVLITAALAVLYGVTMQITRSQTNSSPYASQEVQLSTAQGWTEEAETRTWTFVSANAGNNTFVVTVNEDITSFMRPSLRVRAKQGGAYLYFIVHAVELDTANTLVTLFGGTDYDLSAGDLTDVAWSAERFPLGFPVEEDVWAIEVVDTNNRTSSSVNAYVQFDTSHQVVLPVGLWELSAEAYFNGNNVAPSSQNMTVGLSTSLAAFSDMRLTKELQSTVSGSNNSETFIIPSRTVYLSSETTYYLLGLYVSSTATTIGLYGSSNTPTVIRAVSGYY